MGLRGVWVVAARYCADTRIKLLLLNQIINEGEQPRRSIFDIKPERSGGFKIENEVEPCRLLDR
jgi:hypothetical protein